jgi:broad specificity phosphatase PhoE
MTKIVYLIRHGEVPLEFQGRYIGVTDPPLSTTGQQMCTYLKTLECTDIFSSPLQRALQTAAYIKGRINIDDRLAEIDFGEWENLTFQEISARADAGLLALWAETPEKMRFPGGEAVSAFYARVDDFFDALTRSAHAVTAVVTHGGVLMRIISRIRNIPPLRQIETLPPRGTMVKLIYKQEKWHEA